MKAVIAAFNQEKALVGAFSVITNLRMELFEALEATQPTVRLVSLVSLVQTRPSTATRRSHHHTVSLSIGAKLQ